MINVGLKTLKTEIHHKRSSVIRYPLTITSQNRIHCRNSLHLCRAIDGSLWNVTLLNSWSQHSTALLFRHADLIGELSRLLLGSLSAYTKGETFYNIWSRNLLVYLKETDEWEFGCASVLRWLSVPKVHLTVISVEWSLIKKTNRGLEIRPGGDIFRWEKKWIEPCRP